MPKENKSVGVIKRKDFTYVCLRNLTTVLFPPRATPPDATPWYPTTLPQVPPRATPPRATLGPSEWGTWGAWSSCSKSCGRGWRESRRSCGTPFHDGLETWDSWRSPCHIMYSARTQMCNLKPCLERSCKLDINDADWKFLSIGHQDDDGSWTPQGAFHFKFLWSNFDGTLNVFLILFFDLLNALSQEQHKAHYNLLFTFHLLC